MGNGLRLWGMNPRPTSHALSKPGACSAEVRGLPPWRRKEKRREGGAARSVVSFDSHISEARCGAPGRVGFEVSHPFQSARRLKWMGHGFFLFWSGCERQKQKQLQVPVRLRSLQDLLSGAGFRLVPARRDSLRMTSRSSCSGSHAIFIGLGDGVQGRSVRSRSTRTKRV
jgi:hypothetical protein